MKKTFGIIGAGNIGKAIARHLLKAGHQVIISNSKGPASLQQTVASFGTGARAGSAKEAAQAEIVILALPWLQLPTLAALTDWHNRIVIDATNHFIAFLPELQLADLKGRASSEIVAEYLAGARVVKAFNTLHYKLLESNPQEGNGKRILFMSGDDVSAKKEVSDMIESLGFAAIDLGTLAFGGKLQQAKGELSNLNLVKLS